MAIDMTITEAETSASYNAHAAEELSAAGNGEWVKYPRGADGVSVILDASAGGGRIEATTATEADVDADTVDSSEIMPWTHGDIAAEKKDIRIYGVQAFRQVNISGTTKMSAIANN